MPVRRLSFRPPDHVRDPLGALETWPPFPATHRACRIHYPMMRRRFASLSFGHLGQILLVATGFFVLTLGEARPLQNVGGLTAGAMIAAAFATFVVCPLLARRRHYAPIPAPVDEPSRANETSQGAPTSS